MPVCVCLCLSACLSVFVCLSLSVCLSVCLSLSLSSPLACAIVPVCDHFAHAPHVARQLPGGRTTIRPKQTCHDAHTGRLFFQTGIRCSITVRLTSRWTLSAEPFTPRASRKANSGDRLTVGGPISSAQTMGEIGRRLDVLVHRALLITPAFYPTENEASSPSLPRYLCRVHWCRSFTVEGSQVYAGSHIYFQYYV